MLIALNPIKFSLCANLIRWLTHCTYMKNSLEFELNRYGIIKIVIIY